MTTSFRKGMPVPGSRRKGWAEAVSTVPFKRFALELYRRPGVADACLALQNRHDLDVNVVLFAAFTGAAQRRTLTAQNLTLVSIPTPGRAWRRRSLARHADYRGSARVASGTDGE
jgi:hypothetical protein